MHNPTAAMAGFVASCRLSELPPATIEQSKRTLLNIIGCMVGGARHDSVETAHAALGPLGGAPVATLIGRGQRSDPLHASLINAMSSGVYSFDDTHAQAVVHPGGPVAAALLAIAETRPVSGADFLLAFTLGAEVVCRVSKAASVAPAKPGPAWVQTGICAGIGAAAGTGKLLGLPPGRIAAAMGIAACQSSGIRALTRSMCYSFMVGNAAQSGLRAALLAQNGFTSATDGLADQGAFLQAYASVPDMAALADRLGRHFEIEANTFKPYPCGVVIHPVIDACLDLHGEVHAHAGGVAAIERIGLRVNPAVLSMCDIAHPRDSFEGQVSVQHWAAAALCDGKAGIAQSRTARLEDATIRALRSRIVLQPDPAIDRAGAVVTVEHGGGTAISRTVERCRGSAARPMTNAELEVKLTDQCTGIITPDGIDAIVRACWSIEQEPDAGNLARLSSGARASSAIGDAS